VQDLGNIFSGLIGQVLGSAPVQIGSRLVVAYLAILWLASAFWVFRDARRRTKDLISPYVAAGGVVALTPFLFPLGVIAYRVVRPPETITERAARDLESYVLAASVDHTRCRSCGRTVEETWMRCPACGADLAVACPACGGRVEFDWSVCAWCAHDLDPLGDAATMPAPIVPIDVPAAMADLGAAPPVTDEEVEEPLSERPVAAAAAIPPADAGSRRPAPRARRGAIPGWDPRVVLPPTAAPATRGAATSRGNEPVASPSSGTSAMDETEVGVPVIDPDAPGAAARTWTTTTAKDRKRPASSSPSSRTERRKQRVTVPPELERRRSR